MHPLKQIHEVGAQNLMAAIYLQAVKDYLWAKNALKRNPKNFSAKSMYEETRNFLGDKLADDIDRFGITRVANRMLAEGKNEQGTDN